MPSPAQLYAIEQELARVSREPDTTATLRDPATAGLNVVLRQQWPLEPPVAMVDDLTACQHAIYQVLFQISAWTIDRQALQLQGRVEQKRFELQKVHYDWPDSEDDMRLPAQAAVREVGETTLSSPGSGQQLIEESQDQYAEGYTLQDLGESETPMEVVVWLANKDDRAAMRKALVEAFMGTAGDEMVDRQVLVPTYYNLPVRITATGIGYPDSADQARAKIWPIVLHLTATVKLVRLVPTPPEMRTSWRTTSGVDVDPSCAVE